MTRDEYVVYSREKAEEILEAKTYETIIRAIKSGMALSLEYQSESKTREYKGIIPIAFFQAGRSYLWASHQPHGEKHNFITSRILGASI